MRDIRGYLAALAAGNVAFWVTGLLRALIVGPSPGPADRSAILAFLVVAVFILIGSFVTTILPFIVFLAFARLFRVRAWPYFVVCGMVLGLVSTALVIDRWREWQVWALNATLLQHLTVSGAVGGLVYWRIAVRQARGQPPSPDARV